MLELNYVQKTRAFINKSILNKLIISHIFIILIPILLISYLSYMKLVGDVKSNYNKDNLQILKTLDKSLQMYMEDFKRLTYNAGLPRDGIQSIFNSNNRDQKNLLENQIFFSSFAYNLVGLRYDVEGIYLYTQDNFLFSESRYAGMKNAFDQNYDLANEPWYKKIKESKKEFLIIGSHEPGFKVNEENKYVITAARKLSNYQTGEIGGILFIHLKVNIMKDLFEGIDAADRNIIIVDEDSNIVYDRNEENITKKLNTVYPLVSGMSNGNGTVKIGTEEDYTISITNESLGWRYIEFVKMDKLRKQTWESVVPIIITSILCFVIFMFVSIYISRNIAAPIKILKETMKKVEGGDFTQKANIKNEGEIGSLAKSFNSMVERIQHLITTVYETKLKKIDSEFRALQAQINPHFLYNTLESINCLAQLNDNKEISEMIQGLARMFRYSIKNNKEFVTLQDEINHVKDYIFLQAVRYDNKFDIWYDIPDELMRVKVIKFILQPLVENAIYHGIEREDGKGVIIIGAREEDNKFIISVKNSGNPIDDDKIEELNNQLERDLDDLSEFDSKNKSIGIHNIHLRLRLHYGKGYGLKIDKAKDGKTVVNLILPMAEEVNKIV